MSKAEDLSKELYPLLKTDKIGNNPYISYNMEQLAKQEGFIKGYQQAEKDLELTWKDIKEIYFLFKAVLNEWYGHGFSDEGICREVLKRFKDLKK